MSPEDLRAWRARKDMSLEDLARVLDVNKQTVWRWERGVHAIPRMLDLALWALDHQPTTVTA